MHVVDTLFREIGILCLEDYDAVLSVRTEDVPTFCRSQLGRQTPQLSCSKNTTLIACHYLLLLHPNFSYVSAGMSNNELGGIEMFEFVATLTP